MPQLDNFSFFSQIFWFLFFFLSFYFLVLVNVLENVFIIFRIRSIFINNSRDYLYEISRHNEILKKFMDSQYINFCFFLIKYLKKIAK